MSTEIEPPPLAYATPVDLDPLAAFDPATLASLRKGLGMHVWTLVLSICSIAVCFAWMAIVSSSRQYQYDPVTQSIKYVTMPLQATLGGVLAATVFVSTLVLSIRSDQHLFYSHSTPLLTDGGLRQLRFFSLFAAIGLIGLTASAFILIQPQLSEGMGHRERFYALPLLASFGALTVGVPRFYYFYRGMRHLSQLIHRRGLGAAFSVLGSLKIISDGLLVGSVAIASAIMLHSTNDGGVIVLFGALFGLAGYAAVWIFAMVVHIVLWSAVKGLSQRAGTPTL